MELCKINHPERTLVYVKTTVEQFPVIGTIALTTLKEPLTIVGHCLKLLSVDIPWFDLLLCNVFVFDFL